MKIAWLGTGIMGFSMCSHLLKNNYQVSAYNRSKEKADPLKELGAKICTSVAEAVADADYIFSIVGYPQDVYEVILGADGAINNAKKGAVLVDMTTSKPSLAQEIYENAKDKGLFALDAPVSGGDKGAKAGTLAIMVGGDKDVFEKTKPLFACMGKTIEYMGTSGLGQHTKMANQILIAGNMAGAVEALLYATKAGLDLDQVIDVIGSGAAGSVAINDLGRRIAKNDFAPGFFIKHFIKDMGIALEESAKMGLSLPALGIINQFYQAARSLDYMEDGTQALYKICAQLNGMNK